MTTAAAELAAGEALAAAVRDAEVVSRWRAKTVRVPGSGCLWWTGAVSGRGHGRFWLGEGHVVIAHRFAYALTLGAQALEGVEVLGHRCDNPLCQEIGPEHVVVSSHLQNRREWVARRDLTGSPLGDARGARARAKELRDLARRDPLLVAEDRRRLLAIYGEQMPLW